MFKIKIIISLCDLKKVIGPLTINLLFAARITLEPERAFNIVFVLPFFKKKLI